ncbi:tetratricopeptide repeat protein [Methylopila sp. M107]|uniref:tetratricopeptide repeat protein n=1 Tax=Methylopila sp. M107 TaxID=1101190 RepID=UPI0003664064|nr:tetratricopeptide repeat protein [Methylopila sp. M107]
MARFSPAALIASMLLVSPALAQERAPTAPDVAPPLNEPPGPPAGFIPPKGPAPKDAAPRAQALEADRARAVDELLGTLAKTEDPRSAKRIAGGVQALWMRSGSDTIDLLTARANEAQRAQKLDMAVKLMDQVVGLKPDFAEGWNRRAVLHFAAKNYDAAMADIHETLIREPRHFGAWLALGRILSDAGFDRQALAAFRKTLEIYPAVEGLKKEVEGLTLKVEGQPI